MDLSLKISVLRGKFLLAGKFGKLICPWKLPWKECVAGE